MSATQTTQSAASATPPPIPPAEFAALMAPLGPWPTTRRVAVAVSGGADSLCLAYLTKSWGNPIALIIDHALRPDSATESARAAQTLARLGIPAHIIRLQNLPPGPGISARARAARYAALTQAARAAACSDLLLGHHAHDQAETILLRQQAASTEMGLAGMAALRETADLRLIRPLLSVEPARLRATLHAHNIAWAEDPTNQDDRYARARARKTLAGQGPEIEKLCAQARQAATSRAHAEAELAQQLAQRITLYPQGYALITPGPCTPDLLAALIRGLSGAPYAPRGQNLARLAAQPAPRGTLSNIRFMPAGRLGPGTLAVREPARLPPPIPATNGARWDNRFHLNFSNPLPPGTTLGALAEEAPKHRNLPWPAALLQSLPCLRAPGHPTLPLTTPYVADWASGAQIHFAPAIQLSSSPFRGDV